jgi:hypothetical protein
MTRSAGVVLPGLVHALGVGCQPLRTLVFVPPAAPTAVVTGADSAGLGTGLRVSQPPHWPLRPRAHGSLLALGPSLT